MKENVFFKDEIAKKTGVSQDLLDQLDKSKIIVPAGITEGRVPFYSEDVIRHINHVKKLLEMGYEMEEIEKIKKKVGLPKTSGAAAKGPASKSYLTVGGLADSVGVSVRTIKHWEEKGIIEAEMRTEGGFRLYPELYIYLCKLVKDLQLFGYTLEQIKNISDHFRTFLKIKSDINAFAPEKTHQKLEDMLKEIKLLRERMGLLKEGIERWDELVTKKSREILQLQKENQKLHKGAKEKSGEQKSKST
jgi:DNA-binding transcriptional MerR regulator